MLHYFFKMFVSVLSKFSFVNFNVFCEKYGFEFVAVFVTCKIAMASPHLK